MKSPKSTIAINVLITLVWIISLIIFLAQMGYCYQNKSGHGPSTAFWTICFIPAAGVGVSAFLFRFYRLGAICFMTGIWGMTFCYAAAPLNIMRDYDSWLSMGMPMTNPARYLIIWAFGISLLLVTVFIGLWSVVRTKKGG